MNIDMNESAKSMNIFIDVSNCFGAEVLAKFWSEAARMIEIQECNYVL